jgi:hypothetical protein
MMILRLSVLWSRFSRGALPIFLLGLAALNLQATTYYLDSNKGDDGNAGTDTTKPWKTLDKVNRTTLRPGDKVLFLGGGVWTGQLTIKDAGSNGNPIYIGGYSQGQEDMTARPTINGGGGVQAAVFIKNGADHVTVEGLAVTNFDGKDIFDGAEGDRCGIRAGEPGGDGSLSDIKILHNQVYFVEGCSNHPAVGKARGTDLDPKRYNQYLMAAIFANAPNMAGVTIDGNSIRDCTGTGLMVAADKKVTGLLIQNNQINNVGSDGIEILRAASPVIQYNSCIHAANNSGAAPRGPGVLGYHGLAVAGMWAFGSSDVLFQYNYCEGTKQIKYDGEAWDFDMGMSGTCIYQYNFSRDNEGGFLLSQNDRTPGLHRICRFNISVNDGWRKDGRGEGFFNNICEEYDNNIFYRTDGQPFFLPDNKMSAPLIGSWKNNIFYTTSTDPAPYQTRARPFSNNCFYGFTPKEPGANAVFSDPMFQDEQAAIGAHSLKGLDGFKLRMGSPCQGAGIVIPDNGGKNFWGDSLPGDTANIGAN